jgi:hypothetical protein
MQQLAPNIAGKNFLIYKKQSMDNQTLTNQTNAMRKFKQARICDLLQWKDAKHSWCIYNSGIQYLDEYFNNDKKAINQLLAYKRFWDWWKWTWHLRDEAYLNDIDGREDEISLKQRIDLYLTTHNVKILAAEIHPPRHVYPPNFTHIKIEMV